MCRMCVFTVPDARSTRRSNVRRCATCMRYTICACVLYVCMCVEGSHTMASVSNERLAPSPIESLSGFNTYTRSRWPLAASFRLLFSPPRLKRFCTHTLPRNQTYLRTRHRLHTHTLSLPLFLSVLSRLLSPVSIAFVIVIGADCSAACCLSLSLFFLLVLSISPLFVDSYR